MTQATAARGFRALGRARAIMLTTFRKSGEPVGTPLLLVVRDGGIRATTTATSGKVKRIHNNARVTVASCTQTGRVTGSVQEGHVRLMRPEESGRSLAAIRRRYGPFDRIMSLIDHLQSETEEVGIEITARPGTPEAPGGKA